MDVLGLHHVNVNVHSLPEALEYYVDGLGFAVLERPDFDFAGAWLAMGEHQLHLVVDPAAAIDPQQHFALQVVDLDACCASLDARGVEYRRSPAIAGAGRQAFLRDPSGNRIELNEPAAARGSEG